MQLLEFFRGGERSWIEYAQVLLLLAMLFYSVRKLVADYSNLNETFLINAAFAGLLFLMLGRELSYGKYHGIDDRSVRSIMRIASFIAVFGFWIWSALFTRLKLRLAASAAIRRVRGEWFLLATTAVLFVVSQIVDKDFFYEIGPPYSQVAEEGLETLAYIVLIWVLLRLNGNRSSRYAAGM
jgi:hypothetical protein